MDSTGRLVCKLMCAAVNEDPLDGMDGELEDRFEDFLRGKGFVRSKAKEHQANVMDLELMAAAAKELGDPDSLYPIRLRQCRQTISRGLRR